MTTARRFALLLLSCTAFTAQAEKVYRWVDAQGKLHFSDRPHGNAREVEIKPGSGPGNPEATATIAKATGDCDERRKQLDNYRQAERIVEKDALGREREYTADEKRQLIERSEQAARDACGGAQP